MVSAVIQTFSSSHFLSRSICLFRIFPVCSSYTDALHVAAVSYHLNNGYRMLGRHHALLPILSQRPSMLFRWSLDWGNVVVLSIFKRFILKLSIKQERGKRSRRIVDTFLHWKRVSVTVSALALPHVINEQNSVPAVDINMATWSQGILSGCCWTKTLII